MANKINILVNAILDRDRSYQDIQKQIKRIQNRLEPIKLNIDINDKTLSTISEFNEQMKKISKTAKEAGKVVETAFFPDGTKVTRTYFDGIKGTFKEVVDRSKQVAQSMEKTSDATLNVSKNVKGLNEEILKGLKLRSESINEDIKGLGLLKQRYADEKGINQLIVDRSKQGEIIRAQYNVDHARAEKQLEQERRRKEELKQQLDLLQRQMKVRAQELIRQYPTIDKARIYEILAQSDAMTIQGKSAKDLNNIYRELNMSMKEVEIQTKRVTANTNTLAGAFQNAMLKFPIWMAASTAFFGTFRGLRDILSQIIEIDTQMTVLRRVSGGELDRNHILQESIELAERLGNRIAQINEGLANFARQGFRGEGLIAMTEAATLFSNISEMSVDEAADGLTSIVNGFSSIDPTQVMTVVDAINEVDNNFAISSQNIVQSIQKSVGAAETFGVTLQELIGMTVAIGETTRESGSIIGNSLKTIFSRITTMDDSIEALQSVGVAVRDMEGNIRPVARILDDLAARWHSLSAEQQQFIGLQLAGRFQLSRFLVLMNNYQTAINATNTALNSAGSGIRENEEYLNSLEARLNRVANAWTEFALAAGDALLTDSIIAFSESMTSLIQSSTSVISSVGFLPTVIGLASIAIATFNTRMRTAAYDIANASTSATGLVGAFNRVAASASLAGIAARTLSVVLRSIPQIALFMGVAWAIEKIVGNIVKAREETKRLNKENEKIAISYIEHEKELRKLVDEYERLSSLEKRSFEEDRELLEIQNRINEIAPHLTAEIDEQGNARLRSVEAIRLELEYAERLKQNYNEMTLANFEKELDDHFDKIDELNNKIIELRERLENLRDGSSFVAFGQYEFLPEEVRRDYDEFANQLFLEVERELIQNEREKQLLLQKNTELTKSRVNAYLELAGANGKLNEESKEYLNQLIENNKAILETREDILELANEVADLGEQYATVASILGETVDIKFFDSLEDWQKEGFSAMIDLMNDGILKVENFIEVLPIYIKSEEKRAEIINKLNGLLDKNSEYLDENKIKLFMLEEGIEDVTGATDNLAESYNNAISSITSLNSILDELNEGQGLSARTISTIIDKHSELLAYINDEVALREKIKEKIIEEENAARNSIRQKLMYSEEYYQRIQTLHSNAYQTLAKYYNEDLQNAKNLADAKLKIELALVRQLSQIWAKYHQATSYASETEMQMAIQMKMDQGIPLTDIERQFHSDIMEFSRRRAETHKALLELTKVDINTDFLSAGLSSNTGLSKTKSSSSRGTEPSNMDIIDSLIRQIRLESDLLAKERDLINTRIQIADKNKDYNTQIEQTNLLLEKEEERIKSLINANRRFHEEANRIRATTKFDTTKWFDQDIERSVEYVKQFNSASKSQQEEMERVFGQLQKLKRAYEENVREVNSLKMSIDDLKRSLEQIRFNQIMHEVGKYKDSIALLDLELSILSERNKQLNNSINSLFDAYSDGNVDIQEWVSSLNESKNIILQKIEITKQHIQYLEQVKSSTDLSRESQEKLNVEYLNAKLALEQYNNALIDNENLKRQFLDRLFQEIKQIYIDGYNKQLKIALDAIDKEMKALEKAHNRKMEQLDDELKMIEKIIRARIKLIDEEASEDEFNKRLEKAYKERQEILNKLSVLSLDNSYEANAERERLAEELGAKEEEIEELINSRTKELRKNALNELLDNYRKEVERKRETERQKFEAEKQRLDRVREETNRHYENLINDERRWNQLREEIMNEHFDNVRNDLAELASDISSNMDSIGESITNNFIDKLNATIELINKINSMTIAPRFSEAFGGSSYFYAHVSDIAGGSGGGYIRGTREQLEEFASGGSRNVSDHWSADFRGWEPDKKHDGGIVGQSRPNKITQLANRMLNTKANEEVIVALKNELFSPEHKLTKHFIPNLQKLISSFQPTVAISGVGGINIGDLNFEFIGFSGSKSDARRITDLVTGSVFKVINNGIRRKGYKG